MARGGKRKGAGRPKGTGKFGEPTRAVRLPISMIDKIMAFIERKGLRLPLYSSRVHAAYPGPADNIPAESFDLTCNLFGNGSSFFYLRMKGDAMAGIGLHDGDLLIADKSLEPKHGDVVIGVLDGDFIVRRLLIKNKKMELKPENPKCKTITIDDSGAFSLWGVVKNIVRSI